MVHDRTNQIQTNILEPVESRVLPGNETRHCRQHIRDETAAQIVAKDLGKVSLRTIFLVHLEEAQENVDGEYDIDGLRKTQLLIHEILGQTYVECHEVHVDEVAHLETEDDGVLP